MPKEKRIINVGGTYVEGNVNINEGDFIGGNQNKVEITVANWFLPIYRAIEKRSKTTTKKRSRIQKNVKEIETEIQKGDQADKSFLLERLSNIKKMAPDIWEVVLATISSPVAGLNLAVKKIATKLASDVSKAN